MFRNTEWRFEESSSIRNPKSVAVDSDFDGLNRAVERRNSRWRSGVSPFGHSAGCSQLVGLWAPGTSINVKMLHRLPRCNAMRTGIHRGIYFANCDSRIHPVAIWVDFPRLNLFGSRAQTRCASQQPGRYDVDLRVYTSRFGISASTDANSARISAWKAQL